MYIVTIFFLHKWIYTIIMNSHINLFFIAPGIDAEVSVSDIARIGNQRIDEPVRARCAGGLAQQPRLAQLLLRDQQARGYRSDASDGEGTGGNTIVCLHVYV